MNWHEWVTGEWFPFKEEVNKRLKSLEINEMQCQSNHLPTLERGIESNKAQVKNLRKWVWVTLALVVYIAIEFDKVDVLIQFFRNLIGG